MNPHVIEREVLIEAPVQVVWGVVTEPDQIVRWFSDSAKIDLHPGGAGELSWDQAAAAKPMTVQLRVEAVEPPSRFSFRWCHPEGAEPGPDNSVLVEFTLSAEGDNTRLRVVESGLAALDWTDEQKSSYTEEHNEGWAGHLGRLSAYAAERVQASAH